MLFNSFFFILIFLPITLIGWYWLGGRDRRRLSRLFLICMSLWYYGAFGRQYLGVLAVSLVMNRALALWGARLRAGDGIRRGPSSPSADLAQLRSGGGNANGPQTSGVIALAVIFNLLWLGFFKYVPSLDNRFSSIAMPVGLSFYTFSLLSYVIDVCRGDIPTGSLLEYVLFAVYFPKLAEGPIARWQEVMPSFENKAAGHADPDNIVRGFVLFVLGMAKKVLLADLIAPAAANGFQNGALLDTGSVIVTVAAYAFQLYWDFSGFCDMGMGISRMLGIDLPLNFDSPFKAPSFSVFWQKWHMSLTGFFTRYVYIPLGGSRRGTRRTCMNIMIVFFLSALWHGTGGTYVVWGLLSGALVAACNLTLRRRAAQAAGRELAALRGLTFAVFAFTLIFFGAPDLVHAMYMLRRLFMPMWPGWIFHMAGSLSIPFFYPLEKAVSILCPGFLQWVQLGELAALVFISFILVYGRRNAREIAWTCSLRRRNAVLLGILFTACLLQLTGVSTFLYFKF
ncbi:MAG: MBOAT family protein [Lachnospiraceae bacterium]|nr:MBOAT family protein [Lachnospiraceae bacterium]